MTFRLLLISCLALLLSACGGSGGAGNSSQLSTELLVVSIDSSNSVNNTLAGPGDTVTLTFIANQTIDMPTVTIGGATANVSGDGVRFTASRMMLATEAKGVVSFSIDIGSVNVTSTLDGSEIIFTRVPPVAATTAVYVDAVDPLWDNGIRAFDQSVNFASDCINGGTDTADGSGPCLSISWQEIDDGNGGQLIEVTHADNNPGNISGMFIQASVPVDLSFYAAGTITFDLTVTDYGIDGNSGDFNAQVDCVFPCSSGRIALGSTYGFTIGSTETQSIVIPASLFVDGGLDLRNVNTGLIIFPDENNQEGVVFQVDNIIWDGFNSPVFESVSIASSNATPTIALEGDAVTANIEFAIAPTSVSVITIGGVTATVTGSESTFVASRTISDSDLNSNFEVSVTFVDRDGTTQTSVAETTDGTSVTYVVPPAFNLSISTSNSDSTLAEPGDTISAVITFVESQSVTPTVTIGGVEAAVTLADSLINPSVTSDTTWLATRIVQANESDPTFAVAVTFIDSDGATQAVVATENEELQGDLVNFAVVFGDGSIETRWTDGIQAFDQAIGFGSCTNDGGNGCPSIEWRTVLGDTARGTVIEVSHIETQFAGMVMGIESEGLDLTAYANGNVVFDINVIENPNGVAMIAKADCVGCPTDAGQREQNLGVLESGWQTISIPVQDLINANGGPAEGGLRIDMVTTAVVVFPPFGMTEGVKYLIDNVRWELPTLEVRGSVFDDSLDTQWTAGVQAFDQAIGFGSCANDGGEGCPSINWESAFGDAARGTVIDVSYSGDQFAGIIVGLDASGVDFTEFANGNVVFDINVTANPNDVAMIVKADCVNCPTDAGQREQNLGVLEAGWQTISVPVQDMINANGGPTDGGLRIEAVTTGLVVFPPFEATEGVEFQIDNVRWELASPASTGDVYENSVAAQWSGGLQAFDQAIGFGSCTNDGGEGCPSISWVATAANAARGTVIEVAYSGTQFAGIVIGQDASGVELTEFATGNVVFDINVTANPNDVAMIAKADCINCPTDAGQREQNLGVLETGWQTISVPVQDMINANGGPTEGGLKIESVTTGLVIFPPFGQTEGVVFQIDNIRWEN